MSLAILSNISGVMRIIATKLIPQTAVSQALPMVMLVVKVESRVTQL